MKEYIVNRSGQTPALEEVPTEKEKVYADLASAEADIANIAENEFIDTLDEEVVKEDEIVTKSDFPRMLVPDWAHPKTITPSGSSNPRTWIADEDVYACWESTGTQSNELKIDGITVSLSDNFTISGNTIYVNFWSGYIKSGQTVVGANLHAAVRFRVFPLVTL